MNDHDGFAVKDIRLSRTGNPQTVLYVLRGLRPGQGGQGVGAVEPLGQRGCLWSAELRAKLRPSDEDDRQQLAAVRREIGEQTHILQRFRAEVLGLIDDQHGAMVGLGRAPEVTPQPGQAADAIIGVRQDDPETLASFAQEVPRPFGWPGKNDGMIGGVQPLDQAAGEQRLAHAGLSQNESETASAVSLLHQRRQGFFERRSGMEEPRIGAVFKGQVTESEKVAVHGSCT